MKQRQKTFIDMTGRTYGRLTVLSLCQHRRRDGRLNWSCLCSCGKTFTAEGRAIRKGKVQSCGCLMIERTKAANTRHGMKGTRLYRIWAGMRNRCLNPNCKDYERYGGRGITVAAAWDTFGNFARDMGSPSSQQTLERKDNNLGYGPYNCIWATMQEQANNRRSSLIIEHNGQSMTAANWDRYLGFHPGTVSSRYRAGSQIDAPIQKQFSRPQKRPQNVTDTESPELGTIQ